MEKRKQVKYEFQILLLKYRVCIEHVLNINTRRTRIGEISSSKNIC